jgi:phage-related protein|nr:MAG TPA: tail tape measure protein [Caudoviricetes sp.]
MNLLDLAVKITCDDQASGEVDKIGDGIKNKLGIAAKAGVAAVAAVGTATVAIGKTALDAYSNYEQLVGGIDTLFKASSGKMQQYAANAYQTAGVSANRYMEISTSFAAALISSLGGNTEAAADMANTAITDMSDNANKMGTSLETVQEAYMSLSRGNYEMLDSLKLGYGGTKSELERLLSDAEKFSAAQGKVRDFSVDSYSDIVEAIHIVQDEMGITGTTADEAASTIEGSINKAKAAWDNWLAGLGNEDADMEGLTSQLVESLEDVASNVLPRILEIVTTVIESLPELVGTLAPQVASFFGELFSAALDTLWQSLPGDVQNMLQAAFEAVDGSSLSSSVKGLLDDVFSGATPDLSGITSALTDAFQSDAFSSTLGALSTLLETVESFMTGLGQAAESYLVPALDLLSSAWADLMDAVQAAQPWLDAIAELLGAALGLAAAAAVTVVAALAETIAAVVDVVVAFADGLLDGINAAIEFAAVVGSALMALPEQVASWLSGAISAVAGWVADMASNAVSAGSQFISGLAGFMSGLAGNISSWLSGAISTVAGWVTQFASNATRAASTFGSKLRSGLEAIPGTLGNIGSNIVQGLVNGVTGAAGKLVAAVKGAVGDAIQGAKNLLGIKSPSRVFRKIGQYVMQGAALGVDDDADVLLRSTDNAMRGMISTAQDIAMPGVNSTAGGESAVISWLAENLPSIIAEFTPVMGESEFGRKARKAVAYA